MYERRPDHQILMKRLQKEIDKHINDSGGRPPAPRLYSLRKTVKRWEKELEGYRSDAETHPKTPPTGLNAGHKLYWRGQYARDRIPEVEEKLKAVSVLDLRTDEERRGYERKTYEFSELTRERIDNDYTHRGATNAAWVAIRERRLKHQQEVERNLSRRERLGRIPGHPERLKQYDAKRFFISAPPAPWFKEWQTVEAARAVAEKRGEEFIEPTGAPKERIDAVIDTLAKLEDLDREYADVSVSDDFNPLAEVFTTTTGFYRDRDTGEHTHIETHDASE